MQLEKLGVSYNVSYKVCFTRKFGGGAGWGQGEEKRKRDAGEKEELVVSSIKTFLCLKLE